MTKRLVFIIIAASLLVSAGRRAGAAWNTQLTDADFAALLKEAPQPPDLNDSFL